MHVTGAVAGSDWLRVALPNGQSGYVIAERTRKLSLGGLGRTSTLASAAEPRPPPAARPQQPAPRREVRYVGNDLRVAPTLSAGG